MQQSKQPFMHVGPNATLSFKGMMVNGERAELRHVDDFKRFVFNTSSAVGTVLALLFPEPVAVPNQAGQAEPSLISASEHYSMHAIKLVSGQGEALDSGRIVLQWCLAAYCVARMSDSAELRSSDFLPISLLVEQGGQALTATPETWAASENWKRWQSVDAVLSLTESYIPTSDPRPAAMTVTIPWPEALGASLGGSAKAFENACAVANDIHVLKNKEGVVTQAMLVFGKNAVRFDGGADLADAFDSQAKGYQAHVSLEGARFRAQRVPGRTNGELVYCFRLLKAPLNTTDD